MTCRFMAVAVACLTVLCVWPEQVGAGADQQSQRPASIPPPPNIEEYLHARRVSEALTLHGMHEAAKVNGGEYDYRRADPNQTRTHDISRRNGGRNSDAGLFDRDRPAIRLLDSLGGG